MDQINAVDRHLLVRGAWEAPQVAFLSQLIAANRRAGEPLVLLDIGSHAAFYPIVLSQSITFDRIVAYEPVPVNLAQLRANLMLNGMLSEVEVVEKAVSNGEAKLEFIIGYDNNRGLSRIMDGTKKEKERVIEVVATTIDGSSSYESSLIVCKIDVEGGEMKVIEGMKETIARNRFIFQIENVATRPISQLKELLESLGCKMVHSIAYYHYFVKVLWAFTPPPKAASPADTETPFRRTAALRPPARSARGRRSCLLRRRCRRPHRRARHICAASGCPYSRPIGWG